MGWRINGKRIYQVKGVRKSRKKTYPTKEAAKRALKRRGKRK
ncbi:MAG: hypothetical protein ACTSVV_14400 [Promethearchaeota archaeon]